MRIAVRPTVAPSNSFVKLFSDTLASAGYEVVDFRSQLGSLLGYDVAILHWPNEFLAHEGLRHGLTGLARLHVARRAGMKLVWVAHNRVAHDRPVARPTVANTFLRNLDGIIYLSANSREIIRSSYTLRPGIVECVTVHGRYLPATPEIGFSAPHPDEPVVVASYGHIRPYKNFDGVAAVVAGMPGVELSIFGARTDPEIAARIEATAANSGNLRLDLPPEPFSDAALECRIDAAHGIVLPYRDILNSGAALQALSRNRPVLAPAIGSLPELQASVGSDWVQLYEGDLDRAVIERFVVELRRPRPPRPDLSSYDWSRVGRDLKHFIDMLCGRGS